MLMKRTLTHSALKGLLLILISFLLFGAQSLLTKQIESGSPKLGPTEYSNEQIMAAKAFREIADVGASLLWLKVDTYFHFQMTPGEVMPFIRLVTYLNPGFIDAWTLGTYLLCHEYKDNTHYSQAMRFIDEAISKNRDNHKKYELYYEKGWAAFFYGKDFPTALKAFKEGIETFVTEDDSLINYMTNYLKLLSWNLLLTGEYQAAHECISLLVSVYPESVNREKSIFTDLLKNYDESKKSFDFKKVKFQGFLKKHFTAFKDKTTAENLEFVSALRHHPVITAKISRDTMRSVIFTARKITPFLKGFTDKSVTNQNYSWTDMSGFIRKAKKSGSAHSPHKEHEHEHHHHNHGHVEKIDTFEIFFQGLIVFAVAAVSIVILYRKKKNV
jgi:tetratricopeptide (TPR) repeat protein